jgi:hypothetical protein
MEITKSEAISILEPLMWDFGNELAEIDDMICAEIAQTNADGWRLDYYDLDAWVEDEEERLIGFSVELTFIGDQIEDRFTCGDIVKAKVKGQFLYKNEKWEVEDYEVLKAMSGDSYTDWSGFDKEEPPID